ncbi:hypothetical protein PCANC_24084 [Puccinia coronata f. sp. avenae]|uniref:Reverse transcriptase domain-containing protein n=1 Tax=Puccinia coronata f. sp. avenae TaxID=200324 RepID=A0A2N5UHI4_9BASI|nr:hypothetical protein PCANC_24084 [Puccinia coronata f. sp. avenae]
MPMKPYFCDHATPTLYPSFLIDSGATHNVLNKTYTHSRSLLAQATASSRSISEFNGFCSLSCYEIDMTLDTNPDPSRFIITKLKDSYDSILGMPWIFKYGHQIDWQGRQLRPDTASVATTYVVLSSRMNTPSGLMGNARKMYEGVCALSTIAPPQFKLEPHPMNDHLEIAGKKTPFLDLSASRSETPEEDPKDPAQPPRRFRHLGQTPRQAQRGTLGRCTRGCGGGFIISANLPSGPMGNTEVIDEGVCAIRAVAPPQCESTDPSTSDKVLADGNHVSLGRTRPPMEIDTATVSWSKSAQLAADSKALSAPKPVKTIVPKAYHRFLNMFRKNNTQKLPPRQKYNFCAELLPGAVPQAGHIIPLLPAENNALNTLINNGLANGTIRRTTSPWAAPVLFTGKKHGNLRPCFDYRKLNAVTVKNQYPLPLTMDLVDSLLNADTFTKQDLQNAYGSLWVAEGDEDKLAFVCHAGQFLPLTMPFGSTGAPGYFQFFIHDILLGQIGKDVAAYLDDIMIFTQKGSNYQAAVTGVLETLSNHQLWLKPEKCEFSRPEVEYLGLLISCNQFKMEPLKVKAVTDWPAPCNVTELQRFIGFANFYRCFINHFSGTTRPLHDLTKDKARFV